MDLRTHYVWDVLHSLVVLVILVVLEQGAVLQELDELLVSTVCGSVSSLIVKVASECQCG